MTALHVRRGVRDKRVAALYIHTAVYSTAEMTGRQGSRCQSVPPRANWRIKQSTDGPYIYYSVSWTLWGLWLRSVTHARLPGTYLQVAAVP